MLCLGIVQILCACAESNRMQRGAVVLLLAHLRGCLHEVVSGLVNVAVKLGVALAVKMVDREQVVSAVCMQKSLSAPFVRLLIPNAKHSVAVRKIIEENDATQIDETLQRYKSRTHAAVGSQNVGTI